MTHTASRCILIACVIAALALAPKPDRSTQSDDPAMINLPDFTQLQTGTVTRILDENTILIVIDDRTARYDLLGLASIPARDKVHKANAFDALSRMLLGESVAIQHDPNGDRNAANRLVAHLYRLPDHLPVNLELVRQGYTRLSPAGMSIHTEIFRHYETRARQLERGIWDPNPPATTETVTITVPDQPQPAQPKPEPGHATSIYITTYGTKYHRKDCPHLTDSARPTTREEIDGTHEPCKTCKPDQP